MKVATSPQARAHRGDAVQLEPDGPICIATWGPLDVEPAASLARQTELAAPAKLALSPEGCCVLQAEVLRVGHADAPKQARNAIDVGRAWLDEEMPCPGEALGPDELASDVAEELASALAELPRVWACEAHDDGAFRIHASAFGESVRLQVGPLPGAVRIAARSALATPDSRSRDALVHFALACNRRLRLARIGLNSSGDATAVSWDAVTPPGLDLALALPAAAIAVAQAHATTRRSLRALCQPVVARRYLDAREGAPGGRPSPACAD